MVPVTRCGFSGCQEIEVEAWAQDVDYVAILNKPTTIPKIAALIHTDRSAHV